MTKLFELIRESIPNQESASALVGRLFDAARPSAVFSEPVSQGEYTAITASEVKIGLGYGYGGGGGYGPGEEGEDAAIEDAGGQAVGYGGGGGGGGGTTARPVAVIEVGPMGVRVEPIVDVSAISIAFFTTMGAMFFMLREMKNASEER